jgi:hypothetical protein
VQGKLIGAPRKSTVPSDTGGAPALIYQPPATITDGGLRFINGDLRRPSPKIAGLGDGRLKYLPDCPCSGQARPPNFLIQGLNGFFIHGIKQSHLWQTKLLINV